MVGNLAPLLLRIRKTSMLQMHLPLGYSRSKKILAIEMEILLQKTNLILLLKGL
jgi:hypothetical protein